MSDITNRQEMSMDKHLERILSTPGLEWKKLTEHKYSISYMGNHWHLWPRSGRYQIISKAGDASEMYYGEVKAFYHRYITGSLRLPANSGKAWSSEDEAVLFEMIENHYSTQQIANELERHPVGVVSRLASILEHHDLIRTLTEELYDVPVTQLIDW